MISCSFHYATFIAYHTVSTADTRVQYLMVLASGHVPDYKPTLLKPSHPVYIAFGIRTSSRMHTEYAKRYKTNTQSKHDNSTSSLVLIASPRRRAVLEALEATRLRLFRCGAACGTHLLLHLLHGRGCPTGPSPLCPSCRGPTSPSREASPPPSSPPRGPTPARACRWLRAATS